MLGWLRETIDGLKAPGDRTNAILLLTLGAMYRRAHAATCEIRGGSIEGLRAASRSLVEMLINALYLATDPTIMKARTGAYLADGIRTRKKMSESYLRLRQSEGAPQDELDRVRKSA